MILLKLRTYIKLGFLNLIRVALYRAVLKSGFLRLLLPVRDVVTGDLFAEDTPQLQTASPEEDASDNKADVTIKIFGWKEVATREIPNWHASSITGIEHNQAGMHWTKISDFSSNVGDIKEIWEISRFGWAVQFARQAIISNDKSWIVKLNHWVSDWNKNNPCNQGPNWKCGQETSFRVMHLSLSALLLKQHKAASEVMREMIAQHLRRISPTIHYAVAQDNNHGTSEAAALFIGGLLLSNNGRGGQARRWQEKGRYWLENRIRHLIEKDGSFSQYSVNYHRLMLDTLCLAEVWRREYKEKPFSKVFYQRARAATVWLRALTCEQSGHVPNIGSNDGAWIMPLTDTDYRDFRPTVQLAAVLFCEACAYGTKGTYDQALDLLGVSSQNYMSDQASQIFSDGGYAVLRNDLATTFLRFPKFRFRPSHCDALHLDLFVRGKNILRDSGSYSYNCDETWLNYFSGTEAHNTIQFDCRDQMTKISRFLFGRWPHGNCDQSFQNGQGDVSFSASYTDWTGARHQRKISLFDNRLIVEDKISGFKKNAVQRWRLTPNVWVKKGSIVSNDGVQLKISSESEIDKMEICEGWESRHYGQKNNLPVFEVTVSQNSTIITEISWV